MQTQAHIHIIRPTTDLDVVGVEHIADRLCAATTQPHARVIVDLAKVNFVDSAGMALLVRATRQVRTAGGYMSLINVQPRVFQALKIMRMPDMIAIQRAGDVREIREPDTMPTWRTTFSVFNGELCQARARVQEAIARMPFSDAAAFDMLLAAGEALGNAVDHACCEGVLVTVSAYADRMVIDVADCGVGVSVEQDETPETSSGVAERGKGITLMRMLCDAVRIERKCTGNGTVVHLVKLLS